MKIISTVNFELPSIDNYIEYLSDSSLRDYDIAVFNPEFPYLSRIDFSGGGSCVSIEGGSLLAKAMAHWRNEIRDALQSGKTVFVLMSSSESDSIAVSSTTLRKGYRDYSTQEVNNYDALPIRLDLRNAKGRRFKVTQAHYRELHAAIKDIAEYKVIINSALTQTLFSTNDGSGVLGGVVRIKGLSGHLVLLPHFDLSEMTEEGEEGEVWTAEAIQISKRFIGQLVAIDKALRAELGGTPTPGWIESIRQPAGVAKIDRAIAKIEREISALEETKEEKISEKARLRKYEALLYENGKTLEDAIERSLELLGYKVENYRNGDIEIDHVIVGPSGIRMIGESEGKDNSAIDITKFRQLESNINEDFAREDVDTPAKGVLFGNGYRLVEPGKRENEFTKKCLVNAQRLGTALVRSRDLYDVIVHALDNPKDEAFKEKCRAAIESTYGDVVIFPVADDA
ncbi:hypothetical protein [Pelagibius marinus]|uniref:hypothetical protein n=1 Tax=Pelagibius marinus TaxID=2762760 RepID=UPI0018731DBE|nr:hypothetical protein [Pelagibius marinus]